MCFGEGVEEVCWAVNGVAFSLCGGVVFFESVGVNVLGYGLCPVSRLPWASKTCLPYIPSVEIGHKASQFYPTPNVAVLPVTYPNAGVVQPWG